MLPRLVTLLFLVLICVPPLGQAAWELSRGDDVQALDVFGPLEESRLRGYEKELREVSYVYRRVTPWYQWVMLGLFGRGNQMTIVGRDGRLFFGENLDYVTQPVFGRAGRGAIREAILDFARQLDERGVALVVVPVPAKVAVQPQGLSRWTRALTRAEHSQVRSLFEDLGEVAVWPALGEGPGDPALAYLSRDTHWTPECMQEAARSVAGLARAALARRGLGLEREARWRTEELSVRGDGDLLGMLHLPPGVEAWEPMELRLQRVLDADSGEPFAPDREAEVLLLGDSFTLAFSDPRLGLGEHAGFAEHLALELGAPLDVIALAGGSARPVREALARREEGLDGKKLVIWQLSLRDFASDPSLWTPVELSAGGATATPAAGPVRVRAEITELTRIPGEFRYDFCLAIHEYRVLELLEGSLDVAEPLWVAHVVIEEARPTPQASYEVGQRHLLELEDVSLHHDLEQTSWMDLTASDPRAAIYFPLSIEAADQR